MQPGVGPLLRFLAFAAFFVLTATGVQAHSGRGPAGPESGVKIPGVTHGQMAVIDSYAGQIVDMAERQFAPDEEFRRILNYVRIQKTYCAWGLMPGAVTDETSPFNECSHAYLAAVQNLLVRMSNMPQQNRNVQDLSRTVDMAMMSGGTGLILCAYSGETFNTAQLLRPNWGAALAHAPSLSALLAALLAACALLYGAARLVGLTGGQAQSVTP